MFCKESKTNFKINGTILEKFYHHNKNSTEICIPEGIEHIGNNAFKGCYWLTKVIIPESVKSFGINAFSSCTALKEINLPQGTIQLGKSMFYNCRKLEKIILPKGIENIPDRIFSGCSSIKSIIIPSTVKRIGFQSFFDCYEILNIIIPDSVEVIEDGAFSFCKSLYSLRIGKNVKKIGKGVFEFCEALKEVIIEHNLRYKIASNCIIDTKKKKIIKSCNSNIIPFDTKIIGEGAYAGNTELANIQIPNNIQKIERAAFLSCENLQTVIIPSSVHEIESWAFSGKMSIFCEQSCKPFAWALDWVTKETRYNEKPKVYWKYEWAHIDGLPAPMFNRIKAETIEDLLARNIDSINILSVREYNCLKRCGIKTIEDLIAFNENEYKECCKTVGQKECVTKIIKKINTFALPFAAETNTQYITVGLLKSIVMSYSDN